MAYQVARMTGADWPGDPKIFEYDFKSRLNYKQKQIKNILAELGHLLLEQNNLMDSLIQKMSGYHKNF